jgi:hypothetical protein
MDKLGPKTIKKKLEQLNLEVSLRSINNAIQRKGLKSIYAANSMIVPKRTNKRKLLKKWAKRLKMRLSNYILHFYGFCYLKQHIFKSKAKTLTGL